MGDPLAPAPNNVHAPRNLPRNDPNREPFATHSWIEFVNQAAQARVLDITHGLQVAAPPGYVIEHGQNTRPQYFAGSLEPGLPDPGPPAVTTRK